MRHRTWLDTPVSRRPGHAQAHRRRDSRGGTKPDAGRPPARTLRRPASPASPVVMCRRMHPDGYRRCPLRLALPRVPHGPCLAPGPPGPGPRRRGAAPATRAHHGAAPDAAAVARGAAQSHPAGVWVVPHALAWRHAGPDAAGKTGDHGLSRDRAALAPRSRLGVEARHTRRQRRRSAPGRALGPPP